jgi:hypothetical protein
MPSSQPVAGAPVMGWSDQALPFHASASGSLAAPAPVLSEDPTASQFLAEVHVIAFSPAPAVSGLYADRLVQVLPFQDQAAAPTSFTLPTPMQRVADRHDTPATSLLAGAGTAVQVLPFHVMA